MEMTHTDGDVHLWVETYRSETGERALRPTSDIYVCV